jgi:hypothetical protein
MFGVEMAGVFRSEKGALMVIEPPGQFRVARIFEVDNGVFVSIEQAVFEDLGGPMGHACVPEAGIRVERTPEEAAEERGRGGAVETVVVI